MTQDEKWPSRVRMTMERIVAGVVEDTWGGRLPSQDVLARQFGVSRAVMREAIAMLLSRGMLDIHSKTGTRIRPVRDWRIVNGDVIGWRLQLDTDPQFQDELMAVYRVIGLAAAAQAAVRASADDVAVLESLFDMLRASPPDTPGHQAALGQLVMRILTVSGNSLFQQMAPLMSAALAVTTRRAGHCAENAAQIVNLYGDVVDAIRRAAPGDAYAAMLALIGDLHAPVLQDAP
ncbi:hypothetical protein R75461_08106 [Paraburkholderia nemoris]|uniref:FadR/GntR family transcriptional regulator n=1 Tax=Paraburkholderia nemoris TaxID=2793076 RepID=UPI00190A5DDA|nr:MULTISPECIES: FCD domain-containing protein [Paraburkholderia]MBK3786741.1 FadR family transcriptional regulator [Paraburkholderia aspalathi]CAE6863351.1 hypothetical protein R75461_08106 [Paraburkholderia nemoris]